MVLKAIVCGKAGTPKSMILAKRKFLLGVFKRVLRADFREGDEDSDF